jgi:hypothetical protein
MPKDLVFPSFASRTALLHSQGETLEVSLELRGLVEALTQITAQLHKDRGELIQWYWR